MADGHGKGAEARIQSAGVQAFKAGTDIRANPYNRNSVDVTERLAARAWTRGWATAWTVHRRAAKAKEATR